MGRPDARMKIHGIRIYLQSVAVVRGDGAPIFIHRRASEYYSDFYHMFRPLASVWRRQLFAIEFGVSR